MSRLIQVLLALSLLLNTFFVAGFVFRGWLAPLPFEHRMPPPPGPGAGPGPRPTILEMVTRELNLEDAQRQSLHGVFEQYNKDRRESFREIQRLREEIIAEYKRVPLDQARIDPLIDKLNVLRTDQQKDTVRAFALIEAQIKPEQRERLHQVLTERLSGPPRPPGQGNPGAGRPTQ
jgi:Spy/CpxP family protein refolding chaperone